MDITQEPKYDCIGGKLVNRATGVAIPDDEPVFVLRAKDRCARAAIEHYLKQVTDQLHRAVVQSRLTDFQRFASHNPSLMKQPDSEAVNLASDPEKGD